MRLSHIGFLMVDFFKSEVGEGMHSKMFFLKGKIGALSPVWTLQVEV